MTSPMVGKGWGKTPCQIGCTHGYTVRQMQGIRVTKGNTGCNRFEVLDRGQSQPQLT